MTVPLTREQFDAIAAGDFTIVGVDAFRNIWQPPTAPTRDRGAQPMTNRFDLVQQLHQQQPPERTILGALAFTVRFLQACPAEDGAGLLLKPGGENIAPYNGQMVSVGRVCYPDGALVKILTDIPGTNGPSWQTGDRVDVERYLAIDRVVVDPPVDEGGGTVPPMELRLAQIAALLNALAVQNEALKQQNDANTERVMQRLEQIVVDFKHTATTYAPLLGQLRNLLS